MFKLATALAGVIILSGCGLQGMPADEIADKVEGCRSEGMEPEIYRDSQNGTVRHVGCGPEFRIIMH